MHQAMCLCEYQPKKTTNGHSEQAQTIADLYQALSNLLILVVNDKDHFFPEQQHAIWNAKMILARTKLV